jgi:hypothetical protein
MERLVVSALVNLIVSIDLSDEETVPSDFVSSVFEDVMDVLEELSEAERERFIGITRSLAEAEPSPRRRQALLNLPADLGLIDEDE